VFSLLLVQIGLPLAAPETPPPDYVVLWAIIRGYLGMAQVIVEVEVVNRGGEASERLP
jgi:hypothetical protein